ncbi:MAG: metallophosphoesterase [bacterium]
MKYAIFSDIHSNYESLKFFLDFLHGQPGVMPICLGDVAGYAARPNECLNLLQENRIPVIMGNHDYAVNFIQERTAFNEYALQAIQWQDTVLTPENREILRRLPLSMVIDQNFAVTHADYSDPAEFHYVSAAVEAELSFAGLPAPVGFFGHTHCPGIFAEDPRRPAEDRITCLSLEPGDEPFRLDSEVRYLINPGSLGQPRDGDPRASFLVYDSCERSVMFHRLAYDCEAEARAIREAGLPDLLADRLLGGY